MSKKHFQEKPWYPMAVAACIAVVLFFFLTHFQGIWGAVSKFFGYFKPVTLGIVIAYLVNPLARFFRDKVFVKIKKTKVKSTLSTTAAFLTVLLILSFLLMTLIPQLIDSVFTFAGNLKDYARTLNELLEKWGLATAIPYLQEFINSSETTITTVMKYITDNIQVILSTSASAGRQVADIAIAFMLSIYFLASKDTLKAGLEKLLQSCMKAERYEKLSIFLARCHAILHRYIVCNLLDSLIIFGANAIFMAICGMPYIGLVSFVVAVFNLVPTFGPIFGAAIGAFVLVLVKPWYALAFLIFTIVLQTLDPYYIKVKLFGDTLGVSGLWILVGIVVGGRMFGIIGILIAIPVVAILDFTYREYLMPLLEARKNKQAGTAETPPESGPPEPAVPESAAPDPAPPVQKPQPEEANDAWA
ncbi:MAG: AI-2E family transporter [Lachnospiraceae bacterium]|nr:AI-2E family transporter [Lachnospiraceae bacterium]